ncbi:TetR/AcrR family transcriptional regulator [Oerskovia paurometabola]|uniref:TetR/AcrR family transcriptional regulator n=1 Tax=Oerskovia paurometabola TaxID=162170 RepID=UPI00380473BA
MDPRTERTTAALRTAVLELAAEQDIDELTVSQVSAHAGINRATFYDYASNPADLLTTILRTELDAIRSDFLAAARGLSPDPDAGPDARQRTDPRQLVDTITQAIVGHVDTHTSIYERALEGGLSAPLFRLLAEHFSDTLRTFLLDQPHLMPVPCDAEQTEVEQAARAYACYVALGSVGALEAWLATPSPRDPDFFPRITRTSLAPWWTAPN